MNQWHFLALFLLSGCVGVAWVWWKRRTHRAPVRFELQEQLPRDLPETQPTPTEPLVEPEHPGLTDLDRVKRGLGRTRSFLLSGWDRLFQSREHREFFDQLEETLLSADLGIGWTERITQQLRQKFGLSMPARDELLKELKAILLAGLPSAEPAVVARPEVFMIVGVNGAGKTTTIGKLLQRFKNENKKTFVGAADTFRAAATEQLKVWAQRAGADGVFPGEGTDPAAAGFDTVVAAKARGTDCCLIDTAGRLHTKANLMEELKKMKRVLAKAELGAPHHIWLVIDGTMGQNALFQAREFHQHLQLTGVVVTKLDGSAKGGAALSLSSELQVPIVFVGMGEDLEDLIPFSANDFVSGILGEV